ncbi:hemolysin family protein [Egicoccus halophilus]|uniref:Membrane protein n=1 Tax=Egicoccus halophilus TaxID=1670830 RepID=A0A8J3AH40_9ACTN|nr:hemolysin family protein [Egicoccus halophilus]GGI08318.1 membrane protein [Egicoccus halophilus]
MSELLAALPLAVDVSAAADTPVNPWAILLGLVLLLANGAFVAAEISLLAARRTRIEEAAEAGDPRAGRALEALTELSVTFSGAQLGITMCSLALGAVAEPAVAALLVRWLGVTALPTGLVPAVALAITLSIVVFLHMVVGEMAPKNLALARAEEVALRLARPFGWFVTALRPLILLLNGLANALVRLVRVQPVDEHKLVHTAEELALALAESQQLGTITVQDAQVLDAALGLARIDAEAAMTPRVDLAALPDTATLPEVLELASETGHTRIPVYHDDIDHVVGLVHVKDVLIREDAELVALTVADLLRPIPAVPESRDLEQLLRDMLDERSHAVLVVDEFGGTAGMLTLEDVVEELVGEIADEFDAEQHARAEDERSWVVPGTMRRDELGRLTGLELDGEAETVSGAVVEQLGRLLEPGDRFTTVDGWELTVLTLEGRRAGEIEVRAPEEVGADGDEAGGADDGH